VIKGGRIGFAASSRPDDAEALVDLACDLAAFGAEARFEFPGPKPVHAVATYDPATAAVPVAEMTDLGRALIDGVLAGAPDVLCDADVRKTVQHVHIMNSAGARHDERSSTFSLGVSGQRVRGTDMLWVGDDQSSCSPIRDPEPVITETQRQLERARENVPVRTAELPVIFTPAGVGSALMLPLMVAFNGKYVLQGASPLVESLNQQVYDQRLTVRDDPLIDLRPSSRPFDDEGVPARRTPLVEGGIARQFLYDLQTAGLAGTHSSGSAHRSLGANAVRGDGARAGRGRDR
jgi:PmbA protein